LLSSIVGIIVDNSDEEKTVGGKVGEMEASQGFLSRLCPLGPFPAVGRLLVLTPFPFPFPFSLPFPLPFPLTDLLNLMLFFDVFPLLGLLSLPVGAGVAGETDSVGLGAKDGISELVIVG
jgi:hypothetical protein